MNLFYWKNTPEGVSIQFSYQLGEATLTRQGGFHVVEYNRGVKQIPWDSSPLISAMYVRHHWLGSNQFPPDMGTEFVNALKSINDEREARCFQYCFESATGGGQILWLGVLRNLGTLLLLVVLAIAIIRASRASKKLIDIMTALKLKRCICGYSLAGLTSTTCPECGRTIAATPAQSPTTLDA